MDAMIPTTIVPYMICLIFPTFMFLVIALMKEQRRYKAPIWFGFVAAIITIIIIYIFLPIITSW